MKLKVLESYLDEYLQCSSCQDYAPNGLQVEGRSTVHRIATAVTASESAIRAAIEKNADALIVHHGYFWRGESPCIVGMKAKRIGLLLNHKISLLAYHLPLDVNKELGNNAEIAKRLPIINIQQHTVNKQADLLWSGELSTPMNFSDFYDKLEQIFMQKPIAVSSGPATIKSVAWCSGAAQDYLHDAHLLGVDAFISGEISERTYYEANELGMHYFAAGHHATERFGIQALGQHLSEYFQLPCDFIDTHNPV